MRLELADRKGLYRYYVNELNAADNTGRGLRVIECPRCSAASIDAFVIDAWLLNRDSIEPV